MNQHDPGKKRNEDRGRTNPPGQNPQQNDAVDHDLYHDENRPNLAKEKKQSR